MTEHRKGPIGLLVPPGQKPPKVVCITPRIPPRPSWDAYFLKMAEVVSERSTCLRRKVGAVVVRDKRILSTGYNGAVRGAAHCLDKGCLREELKIPSGERHELCVASHAEQNALAQAARSGPSLDGATLYCTLQPCSICAKMLVQAGIKRIVFAGGYPDKLALAVLNCAGVTLQQGAE